MEDDGGHTAGLLWALRFNDGHAEPGADPLASQSADDGTTWVWSHFPLGNARARAFIDNLEDLPQAAREIIHEHDDRIQLHGDGEWAFGVLPDLERDLTGKPIGVGRLFFALDPRRLITARLHALRVVDDVRRKAEHGERIETPALAIVALVERYTELLESRIATLTDRLDAVEDLVLSEPSDLDSLQLGPFRRELARHRREFQSFRSALTRARSRREGRLPEPLLDEMRLLMGPIEDLDRDVGGLQERARLLHEEIDTLLTSATNRSMRTLTVMSTLLIPPTLIVGAFGMNLQGMPFAGSTAGFALASFLCLMTVVGALALLRRLRLLP